MTMDPRLRGFSSSVNGVHLGSQPLSVLPPNPNVMAVTRFDTDVNNNRNAFFDPSQSRFHYSPADLTPIDNGNSISSTGASREEYSPEDCDFSDTVLKYISQILMEEDMEEKNCVPQEPSLDLQAAEKSFYEVIGKKYPPSPEQNHRYIVRNGVSQDEKFSSNCVDYSTSSYYSGEYIGDNTSCQNLSEYTSQLQYLPACGISQSSYSSSNSAFSSVDGFLDSPSSIVQVPDLSSESQSVWQFRKGVEEASRFLPTRTELFVNLETNGLSSLDPKGGTPTEVSVKMEKRHDGEFSPGGSRGRKKPCREEEDVEEERSRKLAAVYIESTLRSKMFDLVLLCGNGEEKGHLSSFRETLKDGISKSMQQNGQLKGSNGGGKGRGKKLGVKKEVVDLRTLLIQCAQAVAADDHRKANELLKQVRRHSSPFGDGNQRLASCFADGLEARLAGTGSQIYKGLVSKKTCAADMLKAYRLYLAACPFRKMSNFASGKTIMQISAKATRIHVIDFGILYGFQWPTFIQRLSMRDGGPPELRITGIEFPQPGFRPAERVEESGCRLATYAESFKVPFKYSAIAKRWETITVEELKIDKDEVVIVNCLYRGKNLLDESVTVESARNVVLDMIRKINPDIFIHGIVNGAYNAPFFVTRFREALFHFSAIFDMLETIVPRGEPERMLIEKEIFGREALNVIACEGWERVERPETYKQWQIRIMRSGFVQIPLGRDIVKRATEKVRSTYHRDFIIDEDSGWLVQGWKGRIIFALSSWKPA